MTSEMVDMAAMRIRPVANLLLFTTTRVMWGLEAALVMEEAKRRGMDMLERGKKGSKQGQVDGGF